MLTEKDIQDIRNCIDQDFFEQVKLGQQTVVLGNNCCGQFLKARNRTQRGAHGTSAALSVLAQSNNQEHRNLVAGLVTYLERRSEIEGRVESEDHQLSKARVDRDSKNVIKLGETLAALSVVTAGVSETDSLKKTVSALLKNSLIEDRGWPYYVNAIQPAAMLPTGFAVLGLCANGDLPEARKGAKWLSEELAKVKPKDLDDPNRFSEYCFVLYVLSRCKSKFSLDVAVDLKKSTRQILKAPLASFVQNIEQNVEYSHNTRNDYVRIPWQLYLMASVAMNTPNRLITVTMRRHLAELLKAVKSDEGFKYRLSGAGLSSRTNAILYECIVPIGEGLKRPVAAYILLAIDGLRLFFGNLWVKRIITWLATLFIIGSLILWWRSGGRPHFDEWGAHLTIVLLIALSVFGKAERK